MSYTKRIGRTWFMAVALLLIMFCAPAWADNRACTVNGKPDKRPWLLVGLSSGGGSSGCGKVFSVIKEVSGNPNGTVLPFSKVTYELLSELKPEFIVLSPQGTPWCRYTGHRGIALQNFLWMLPQIAEQMNIPILGICGGHQALALAFGGKVGPIRAGEDDCMPYTRDRQGGVIPLKVTAQDPLFEGLQGKIRIVESHFDEVKVLPPGFVLLASDKVSPNQIMRHPTKPVYGIQGHPEYFSSHRPDTGIILKNFMKIVESYTLGKPKQPLVSLPTSDQEKSPN